MLTLLGVKGHSMGVDPSRYIGARDHPIDRDALLLPEVVIEDYGADVARALKPAFDVLWNAAGWDRSLNYDSDGTFRV